MRALRLLAVVLVCGPTALGAACSSSDPKPATAGAAGQGGAAGAGGTTAGGSSATGGASGAGAEGGTDSSGGTGAGTSTGPGPTGAGAGPSLCKTSGDGAIFGITHPDCQPCALMWCDTEYTDAYGPQWSSGDLTTGGVCQAYESCAAGKCKCAPTCVAKTCMSALSAQCQTARSKVDACMSMSCYLPCGLAPTSDAGPNLEPPTRPPVAPRQLRFAGRRYSGAPRSLRDDVVYRHERRERRVADVGDDEREDGG